MELHLPARLRSPIDGGTDLWDRAQVAWEVRQSLPEFEDRPQEQQDWLLAVWRAKRRISVVELIESDGR